MRTFAPKGNVYGPIMPMYVFKRKISHGAKIMYGYLCNLAGCNDHCWPLNKTIADSIGICETSVKNYMKELTSDNLIEVRFVNNRRQIYFLIPEDTDCGINIKFSFGKNNANNTPYYSNHNSGNLGINTHGTSDSDSIDTWLTATNCQKSVPKGTILAPHQAKVAIEQSNFVPDQPNFDPINNLNKQNKEIKNTPPFPPTTSRQNFAPSPVLSPPAGCEPSFPPDFESIWKIYPKQVAKGEAFAAWRSLQRKKALPPVKDLQDAIGRMRSSKAWQKEDGRFVPLLGKWLRTMGWYDQLSETERAELAQIEKTRKRLEAEKERDREVNEKRQKWFDSVRPEFDAFAAKFASIRNRREAFGLWCGLRDNGVAPTASDVPDGSNLDITAFLLGYRNRMNSQPAAQNMDNGPHNRDLRTLNNCNAILAMLRNQQAKNPTKPAKGSFAA